MNVEALGIIVESEEDHNMLLNRLEEILKLLHIM